ncbi:hypothetical protein OAS39_07410 [Pirellulales bacterium]|nr:hypothetical protein [Pirellulales bacterium]
MNRFATRTFAQRYTLRKASLFCTTLLISVPQALAVDIRAWRFEATVVSLDDPQGLFADVRLGDGVYGSFAYDVDLPQPPVGSSIGDYDHPLDFHGIRLAIDNPRTGEQLKYTDDPEYGYLTSVFTDESYLQESALLFWQDAIPPLPGLTGLIFMEFSGPDVFESSALPTAIALDDWPFAAVFLGADNPINGITAQLFSISEIVAGDYDQDDDVDGHDLIQWETDFGLSEGSDANRDGRSAGTDLLSWQRHYDERLPAKSTRSASQTVPEPGAAALATLAIALFHARQFRKRGEHLPTGPISFLNQH